AKQWSLRRSAGSSGRPSHYASPPGSCLWSAAEGNTTPLLNAFPNIRRLQRKQMQTKKK
ncbi:N-acetylaspartate synthetase, partial [Clarias magur]